MSPPRPARPALAIGDTIAKVTEMLDDVGGTVDRDRRRAAARLSELVRSGDDDLGRFAERHLPGRDLDGEALKEARELAVELARLIALIGDAPGAAAALRELRETMSRRRDALERGEVAADVTASHPLDAAGGGEPSARPPTLPAPAVTPSLPTFMQSPPAGGFPGYTAPTPPAIVSPPAFVSPSAPAPLPFAPPAAPAPGAADPPAKPGPVPGTGLPFTRDPRRG